jgi:hypothetical protein
VVNISKTAVIYPSTRIRNTKNTPKIIMAIAAKVWEVTNPAIKVQSMGKIRNIKKFTMTLIFIKNINT